MHPTHPGTPLPARARRARRIALPIALTGAVLACSLTTVASGLGGDTAAAAPGSFTIGARPVQLSQPSDPELGVVAPTADAAENGMFGTQVAWPLLPLHAAVSRTGKLISYGTPLGQPVQGGLAYDDWDPSAGFGAAAHVDTASMNNYDSFCNALIGLDDGRMLMVGGNSAAMTMIYDPTTDTQTMGQNLNSQRWYGTALRTVDGRILMLGGGATYYGTAYQNPDNDGNIATTPEIGSGTGAWTNLTGATSSLFGARDNRYWYPRAFNGPNGTVVGTSADRVWTLSTAGGGSVAETGTLPFNPRASGSQVMYAPGKVLIAGGGQAEPGDGRPATNQAAVVDFSGQAPVVTPTAPMANARNWLNLTVLPNGEVLANGGTRIAIDGGDANSVRQAEIWNPASGTWRPAATALRTRTYHSVSLLMPSGAVFTGGGGAPGPEDNLNAELYYPAYLFTKNADGTSSWASRPAITAISGSATHGGTVALAIGDGRAIASASLISLPTVTHSQNTDQRRIPLAITQQGGTVSAVLPASANEMPPGDYELTVVDANGVPSAAQIITIRNGAAGLVTTAADNPADAPVAGGAAAGSGGGNAGGDPVAQPNTGGGQTTGGGTTQNATAPLTVDTAVGLSPTSATGTLVSVSGSSAVLRTVGATASATAKQRSSWIVRPGLASGSGVSFESVDRPGSYLAAPTKGSGSVTLVRFDRSTKLAARATFVKVGGNTGSGSSFTTWTQRSRYLKVSGSAVSVGAFSGSKAGRSSSTFLVRTGLTAAPKVALSNGRSVGIEAVGKAGYRIRLSGSSVGVAKVARSSSTTLREQTSWVVHTVAGGVRLESVDRPGYYLAAPSKGAGALTRLKRSGSASFAARTTFAAVTGVTEGATSFRLKSNRALYLQRDGSRIVVKALVPTRGVQATFSLHSGWAPTPTR